MTVDEIKEVQMKKELQRANPIWNYFSGFSYDASVLFDYDLMPAKSYKTFIASFRRERELPAKAPVRFNRDDLFQAFNVGLTPSCSVDYSLSYNQIFRYLYFTTSALRMKRRELGLGFSAKEHPLDEKRFNRFKQGMQSSLFQENPDVCNEVCLAFISNVISDLNRFLYTKDENGEHRYSLKDRARAYSNAHYLEQSLQEVATDLSDTIMSNEISNLMECIVLDGGQDSPLFPFHLKVLQSFDLMKKPLRAEESYQKLLQLLELTKQAIVFHPLEKMREKIAIFDCIHDVEKSVISKHNAKLVNSICKIYKERGQNEVAG